MDLPLLQTYFVTFRINYKVNYGEELSIVGDIPELGNWHNTHRARMKWSEGDIWAL